MNTTLRNIELGNHVRSLCVEHRIQRQLTFKLPYRGQAWLQQIGSVEIQGITVPPVGGELSYLISMHEIGHHLTNWRTEVRQHRSWNCPQQLVVDWEIQAWDWAFTNSKIRFCKRTRRRASELFRTYLDEARSVAVCTGLTNRDGSIHWPRPDQEAYCSRMI